MDRYVTVETPRGTGRILHDNRAVGEPVRYELVITQKRIDTTTHTGHGEISGMKRVEGRISGPVPAALIGIPIHLELEDGRRWSCFIQSANGSLVNRGGFQ